MTMLSSSGGTRLKNASGGLMKALGNRAVSSIGHRVSGLTDRLQGLAEGNPSAKAAIGGGQSVLEGESPVKGALKGAASGLKDKVKDVIPGLGGGGGGGGKTAKPTKATNIIEETDVGVQLRVAYNQWTQYGDFPSFMKKVENVDAQEDNKIHWKAKIVWSHREWDATILQQIPDEQIVWRSKGKKGHVDGAVTFHELAPNMTLILVVLEYYPQGLFERIGNIWRAQGRRARLEIKHFRRHVMTRTILDPDEVEGWRGTIRDSEVVTTHEEAMEQEAQQEQDESSEDQDSQGRDDDGSEDSSSPEDKSQENQSDEDLESDDDLSDDSSEEDDAVADDLQDEDGEDVVDDDVAEDVDDDMDDDMADDVDDDTADVGDDVADVQEPEGDDAEPVSAGRGGREEE